MKFQIVYCRQLYVAGVAKDAAHGACVMAVIDTNSRGWGSAYRTKAALRHQQRITFSDGKPVTPKQISCGAANFPPGSWTGR